MAMGIPVITNSGVGDLKEIVENYGGGFVIDDFSKHTLEQLTDKLCAFPEFNRDKIREGAFDFYSLQKAISKYENIYKTILQ